MIREPQTRATSARITHLVVHGLPHLEHGGLGDGAVGDEGLRSVGGIWHVSARDRALESARRGDRHQDTSSSASRTLSPCGQPGRRA